jgi:hypothetical protein
MKGRWFRAYEDALHDPKVQTLPLPLFKAWFNLLCIASKNDGKLPGIQQIAFDLRVTEEEASSLIDALMQVFLVDKRRDGDLEPHNWQKRQFLSDHAAERMKNTGNARKRHALQVRYVTRYVTMT